MVWPWTTEATSSTRFAPDSAHLSSDARQTSRGGGTPDLLLRFRRNKAHPKSCHTGEGRCPWQSWVPAFAGKTRVGVALLVTWRVERCM